MQRMAQGGCAVRGARQNAGVNARKWGTLDKKRGTFEWKVPDVRLFVPKGGGEKQEKAEEGAEEVKRYGRSAQFGAAQRAECGG